ncbi:unnamed protein product [Parnassius apollo]|uniref:(apollo) hypothetical protein n=1 Tax=Parnassius apollo TaxID=110799 RepID=A0A8S3X235_PARAO|nr:unnamed protein product [Parnassius apollo]
MRYILLLLFLIIWYQDTHGYEKINNDIKNGQNQPREFRAFPDLWNSVKKSAANTWETLKLMTNRTGEKIKEWFKNIKIRAKKAHENFKNRIQKMQENIKNIIEEFKVTGQIAKKCIQNEQKAINEILKEIIENVSTCISKSFHALSLLESSTSAHVLLDKTEYITNVENKLYQCLDNEDVEECYNNVRKSAYDNLEREEKEILQNRADSRAATDDILDTIVTCTSNGLIKASDAIANTTHQVIKCVKKGV